MLSLSEYTSQFHQAIRDGKNENSYKLAWARAIVELAAKKDSSALTFEEIGERMFSYYWNYSIFFDLYQGQNPNRQPEIVALVKNSIEQFYRQRGNRQPVGFMRAKNEIAELPALVKQVAKILKQDVCFRFLNVGKEKLELYEFDVKQGTITLPKAAISYLRIYRSFLLDAICLKWTQKCEQWNRSPRIASKIHALQVQDAVSRGASLSKFHTYLLLENAQSACFYSGESVGKRELSIDHVIPWSFMFSDDLWNLVITSRKLNSAMGNIRPDKDEIERLKERNVRLLKFMDKKFPKSKETFELRQSIERKFLDEYFFALG